MTLFELAAANARTEFGTRPPERTEETHWNLADAPVYQGRTRAACGEMVPYRTICGEPTCPKCRAFAEEYNKLDIG